MKRSLMTAAVALSFSCLLLAAGCGHHSDHDAPAIKKSDQDSQPFGMALELDRGQKWKVDEHTRGSADRMIHLVRNAAPFGSVEDARAFANSIDEELKGLIQGCTMTGPAHDQLHVFLVALFPRVEALKNKSVLEELRTVRQEIVSVFDSYERHFE